MLQLRPNCECRDQDLPPASPSDAGAAVTHLTLARVPAPEPIGPVFLAATGDGVLVALDFGAPEERMLALLRARFGGNVALADAGDPGGLAAAVRAYFAGDVTALDQVPADGGGTPFQRLVWAALREIPAGETRSYGQVAARIGRPGASRAVGMANSQNPINLTVPCHRVIGSTGMLTGYGGGIERKRWLLAHESRVILAGPQASRVEASPMRRLRPSRAATPAPATDLPPPPAPTVRQPAFSSGW